MLSELDEFKKKFDFKKYNAFYIKIENYNSLEIAFENKEDLEKCPTEFIIENKKVPVKRVLLKINRDKNKN